MFCIKRESVGRLCHALIALVASVICATQLAPVQAASLATIRGIVASDAGIGLPGVRIVLTSQSDRHEATTDERGSYQIDGLEPDTYTVAYSISGYDPIALPGLTLTPDRPYLRNIKLTRTIATIGRTSGGIRSGVAFGRAGDVYTVAQTPASQQLTGTASGLGTYTAGTILGTVSNLPGVTQDQYSDLIVRGSKTYDSIFALDGIPFPQEFVSTPGGTTFGSPLSNVGIRSTSVQQAGFTGGADSAFGAIVNEIPISGSYPGSTQFTFGTGLTQGAKHFEFTQTGATRDQHLSWAFAGRIGEDQLISGNGIGQPGTNFYTGLAGGNSLDYTLQKTNSGLANVHYKLNGRTDLQLLLYGGSSHFDQYGQPYPGLTSGSADGLNTTYPGANPYAPITTPGKDDGSFSLQALKVTCTNPASLAVVHYARAIDYGSSHFIVGSDNTFPIGWDSYSGSFWNDVHSLGVDVTDSGSAKHEIAYGFDLRLAHTDLNQVEAIIDDHTTSLTRSNGVSGYVSDRFALSNRLELLGSLRAQNVHEERLRDGHGYTIGVVDPHVGVAYKFGHFAFLANYDRISQAPLPYAIDRFDSVTPVPYAPVTFENGHHFVYSIEARGRINARVSYWRKNEYNRLDILPASLAVQSSSTSVSASPSSIGLPANLGLYKAHGADFELSSGKLHMTGTYTREIGLDSSQYSLNQVNPAQVFSGGLIPGSFFPDFSSTLSYAFKLGGKTTIAPQLSYESGMPYGNGRKVYTTLADGSYAFVNNDNHVNPGYAYYFLKNPAQPFDATSNPYTASINNTEGDNPQTARLAPRTFLSLHIEHRISKRISLSLDGTNLLNFTGPIELLSNGYAPGPPGYTGGDPLIAAWMSQQFSQRLGQYRGLPYILGNGIPTIDGYHPQFGPQFNYGTGPYVTAALPYRRTINLTMTVKP